MTNAQERAKMLVEQLESITTMDSDQRRNSIATIVETLAQVEAETWEQVIGYLRREAQALPVQHEIESHGCYTYNWYRHIIMELERQQAQRAKEGKG